MALPLLGYPVTCSAPPHVYAYGFTTPRHDVPYNFMHPPHQQGIFSFFPSVSTKNTVDSDLFVNFPKFKI